MPREAARANTPDEVAAALAELHDRREDAGDGRWFEELTLRTGPGIPHWDLRGLWRWNEWPRRGRYFPDSSAADIAVDLVGERACDGLPIAVQCKARAEDTAVTLEDMKAFLPAALAEEYAEAWIVGTTHLSRPLREQINNRGSWKIRFVRLDAELTAHASSDRDDPRTAIHEEAVQKTLEALDGVRQNPPAAWRPGTARGRVVMPCGTGKTRVGYLLAKRLIEGRQGIARLVVVLCPSIGLVRQLKHAWEAMGRKDGEDIRTLCVCSDSGLAPTSADADRSIAHDPTVDLSQSDGSEITGDVVRAGDRVAAWIEEAARRGDSWPVIIGTYQSGVKTAEGLTAARAEASVLIADEAHRTAGLKKRPKDADNAKLRDFTVCHNDARMPARTRIYMTATPKTFTRGTASPDAEYAVVAMNDEKVFGVHAYELSYGDAVERKALTDYRIAAIVPDRRSHVLADKRAAKARARGENPRFKSASLLARQLTYAVAITRGVEDHEAGGMMLLPSSIAFCNRTATSKAMTDELREPEVRAHVAELAGVGAVEYSVHHREAGDNADRRRTALTRLMTATPEKPVGVSNVGIFGEGIDTPDLAAIAFIEPRKGPVDVVQAVGRVMRLSPKKELGLILAPLEIPLDEDPETWLETRGRSKGGTDGFEVLGQILNALRAHDGRIEDRLSEMLDIHTPAGPGTGTLSGPHIVAALTPDGPKTFVLKARDSRIENELAVAADQKLDIHKALKRADRKAHEADPEETLPSKPRSVWIADWRTRSKPKISPLPASTGAQTTDVHGCRPVGPIAEKAHSELKAAVTGRRKNAPVLRPPVKREQDGPPNERRRLLDLIREKSARGEAVRLAILKRSGLASRSDRHLEVLLTTVKEAAGKLRAENLDDALAGVLEMDLTAEDADAGDACMVAGLVLTTAALVQTRLEAADAFKGLGVEPLENVARESRPAVALKRAFNRILVHDYQPVFTLGRDVIAAVLDGGKGLSALDAAVRGVIEQSRDVAEQYAEAGADYAGALFNEIMHDRASDGAYFTRPQAAALLAELALAAAEPEDGLAPLSDRIRAYDPACGSGTLLQAWLTAVKNRYAVGKARVAAKLHRRVVEECLLGHDVNPVSIQLAGAMLMIGDPKVSYRAMRLSAMPYGPGEGGEEASAGSLELLFRRDITERDGEPLLHSLRVSTAQRALLDGDRRPSEKTPSGPNTGVG